MDEDQGRDRVRRLMETGVSEGVFPGGVALWGDRERVRGEVAAGRLRTLPPPPGPPVTPETLYDLAEIGAEYVTYRAVADHWRRVLPNRMTEVPHEALVADPRRQIRWLVTEACGLSWDEACLAFHETGGAVRTASSAQVRQPIFRTSVGRWRRYERGLGPLKEALGRFRPA